MNFPTTQKESNVKVKIIDSEGVEEMSFFASKPNSLVEDAAAAGHELPTSCCAGACFVCAGHVKQWLEYIDIGKLSVPLIDIDEDQVLMCVWGIYDSAFDDWEEHEIIIQKEV